MTQFVCGLFDNSDSLAITSSLADMSLFKSVDIDSIFDITSSRLAGYGVEALVLSILTPDGSVPSLTTTDWSFMLVLPGDQGGLS